MLNNRPGMRCMVNCEVDNTPSLRDDEEMNYAIQGLGVAFRGKDPIVDQVNLFVTTSRIILIGEFLTLDFDVAYVTLHAVTRDPESYAKPCVYCQFDFEEDSDDEEEENDENSVALKYPKGEMYLVPNDEDKLTEIFNAFSHAALMNPDPPEDGEEEGDDELIYNTDEVALGVEQQRALEHLESVFHLPGDENSLENFEDAPDA
jgi:nucleotide-sensitive chloride channel 1A